MKTRRPLLLLLVAVAVPWGAITAWAGCERFCAQSYGGNCVTWWDKCTPDEPPKPKFGAIAYGRDSDAHGYSHGYDNQAQAEKVAKDFCAKNGGDCRSVVWFKNNCGAVAVSDNSREVYWGVGDSAPKARQQAMAACAKDGGQGCQVKVSHCSR